MAQVVGGGLLAVPTGGAPLPEAQQFLGDVDAGHLVRAIERQRDLRGSGGEDPQTLAARDDERQKLVYRLRLVGRFSEKEVESSLRRGAAAAPPCPMRDAGRTGPFRRPASPGFLAALAEDAMATGLTYGRPDTRTAA